MADPVWVREDVVRAIHLRQIAEHGSDSGIRDQGLFSSALARAANLLAYAEETPDLAALAAAYAFGITRNHPFIDGNKRTAFVVCRTFLKLNGLDVDASSEDKYAVFLQLASGELTEEELIDWIRSHSKTV